MKTKELAQTAVFVAMIAVCAQISIPSPIVPFTLQVFAISLIASVLKPRHAAMTVTTYLIMGLMGFPIFAGGSGGIQAVLFPTFGFLLGFIPFTYFFSSSHGKLPQLAFTYILFYAFSLTVLALNLRFLMDIHLSLTKLVTAYWLMFMPTDLLSMVGAYLLGKRLKTFF